MSKDFVTVSTHRRAFPKRKFADGGTTRGLDPTDPDYEDAVNTYLAQGHPRDQAEAMVKATGANPIEPFGKPSTSLLDLRAAPSAPAPTPSTESQPAIPPPAPENTLPTSRGDVPGVKPKLPATSTSSHDTSAWLRALSGAALGGGMGVGALSGAALGLLLPLIWKNKRHAMDEKPTPDEAAKGGPIGEAMAGRTMKFQMGGVNPTANPGISRIRGQLGGRGLMGTDPATGLRMPGPGAGGPPPLTGAAASLAAPPVGGAMGPSPVGPGAAGPPLPGAIAGQGPPPAMIAALMQKAQGAGTGLGAPPPAVAPTMPPGAGLGGPPLGAMAGPGPNLPPETIAALLQRIQGGAGPNLPPAGLPPTPPVGVAEGGPVPYKKGGKVFGTDSADGLPPVPPKKVKAAFTRKPKGPAISIAIATKKKPDAAPSPYDYEDAAPVPPAAPPMAKGGAATAKAKGGEVAAKAKGGEIKKAKGGECDDKMAKGGPTVKKAKGGVTKLAAGGAAKQRRGFPNTSPPKRLAAGGKVRGCGAAIKGCTFTGCF